MKKLFILLFICLFSLNTFAQEFAFLDDGNQYSFTKSKSSLPAINPFNYNNDASDFPRKYYSFFLGFGTRSLLVQKGPVAINLQDESGFSSPKDYLTSESGSKSITGMQFGFSMGKYTKLAHSLVFDISIGKQKNGFLGYSVGWNFPFEVGERYLILKTGLMGVIGVGQLHVGDFDNSKDFVLSNSLITANNYKVAFETEFAGFGPQVEVSYFLFRSINMYLSMDYLFVNNYTDNHYLIFTPEDATDSSDESRISIFDDNPSVEYENKKLEEVPFKYGGLRMNIGFTLVLNRV